MTRSPTAQSLTPSPSADDLAGEVDAHDAGHRHLDAGHAAPREDVVVVERRRLHRDDDFARGRLWIGKSGLVADRARTAVLVDDCCFHGVSLASITSSVARSLTSARARSRASALRSTLLVRGERQLRHEDDTARMLVGRRVVERVPLDLVLGQTCAGSQHDEGERLLDP